MREVGLINGRDQANRFVTFLSSRGIESELRDDANDRVSVWVLDDDQVNQGRRYIDEFRNDPENKKYDAQPSFGKPKMATPQKSRHIDVRTEVFHQSQGGIFATIFLIGLSIVLSLSYWSEPKALFHGKLFFSEMMGRGFSEILSGEVWRLVTPIFLHGNGLHLGFNMLWLYQLGRQIELFQGSRLLFLQVVLFAVICNTSQYLVSGPAFLGMSGVVYGLLGYIWMMARYDIKHRYELNSQTIMIMVIWMVICLVGIIPNVANTQHVMGFISGTLWGFFASGGIKQELRRRKFRSRL